MIHSLPHCPKQGTAASLVSAAAPGGSRARWKCNWQGRRHLGSGLSLTAESDPLVLQETRIKVSFCWLAFCIWSSASFQGTWFFRGAADRLQSIPGKRKLQETRLPWSTFQMEFELTSLLFTVMAFSNFYFTF